MMKNIYCQSLTIDGGDRVYFSSTNTIYEMNVGAVGGAGHKGHERVTQYTQTSLYGSARSLAIAHRDAPLTVSLASGLRQFTRIGTYFRLSTCVVYVM
jgi:hypothetical protein